MSTLTKAQRADIASALMKRTDFKKRIDSEFLKLGAHVVRLFEQQLLETWGDQVYNVAKKWPKQIRDTFLREDNHVELRSYNYLEIYEALLRLPVYDEVRNHRNRLGVYVHLPEPVYTRHIERFDDALLVRDVRSKAQLEKLVALINEYAEAYRTLELALAACRTHKQLTEAMPEIADLLPKEVKTYELTDPSTTANAVAMLMSHGAFKEEVK